MTECRHGLDPAVCSDCSPGENDAPPRGGPLGSAPRTTARYEGTCLVCGDGIAPGDGLVEVDEAWIHEGCW